MELDVGRTRAGLRVPETAGLEQAGGDRSLAQEQVLQPCPRGVMRLVVLVVGVVAGALGDDEQVEVILQVRTNAGEIVHHADPDRAQVVGGSDAGLQQQLG